MTSLFRCCVVVLVVVVKVVIVHGVVVVVIVLVHGGVIVVYHGISCLLMLVTCATLKSCSSLKGVFCCSTLKIKAF